MASQFDQLGDIGRVFKILADKTRLRILLVLAKGEMGANAIHENLNLPQSTVAHHLRQLRLIGMVSRRSVTKYSFYSLADLSQHYLGRKSKLTASGSNAAKFGPVELAFPQSNRIAR